MILVGAQVPGVTSRREAEACGNYCYWTAYGRGRFVAGLAQLCGSDVRSGTS